MTDPDKPADDWTQTDELAARFMAAMCHNSQRGGSFWMAKEAYAYADAFMAERQRRKGAGE